MRIRRWRSAVAFATLCSSAFACQLAFPTVEAESTTPDGGAAGTDGATGARDGDGFSDGAEPTSDGDVPGASGPSCDPVAKTCGSAGDRDCCASAVVPNGTFSRSYDNVTATDPSNSATIAALRLDVFEVTVGRFRKFLSSFPAKRPTVGSGKNPNNPADPGWLAAFDADLPADSTSFKQAMNGCSGHTWTDADDGTDSRPINCIRWAEAFAFCIWDGARLPTEAEWNFAAAGGDEQRVFPWSSPPNATAIDATRAVFNAGAPAVVGSHPLGDGRWGHADLAGNVAEWTLDFKSGAYIKPCVNCAELSPLSERIARGGGFDQDQGPLHVVDRGSRDPHNRFANVGVRCARN